MVDTEAMGEKEKEMEKVKGMGKEDMLDGLMTSHMEIKIHLKAPGVCP